MVNTVNYGLHSFRYHEAKMWNMLPSDIKNSSNVEHFKKRLFKWNGTLCKVFDFIIVLFFMLFVIYVFVYVLYTTINNNFILSLSYLILFIKNTLVQKKITFNKCS